jgi:hypothetical protein
MPKPALLEAFAAKPAADGAWSPLDLPNLYAWYDFSDAGSITSSGGFVSQVDDLSGNARHITNAVSDATRPNTGATINGVGALVFDVDADDLLINTSFSMNANATTIYVACEMVDNNTIQALVRLYDNSNNHVYWCGHTNGDQPRIINDFVGGLIGTGSMVTSPHVVTYKGGPTNQHNIYIDGVADANNTSNGSATATRCAVGFAEGDIGEVIIVNTTQADADREDAEAYLMDKWGI